MAGLYRRAIDALYPACVIVGVTALVPISAVIPWAVFTRYVLNGAASWPEAMAVLLCWCHQALTPSFTRSRPAGRSRSARCSWRVYSRGRCSASR